MPLGSCVHICTGSGISPTPPVCGGRSVLLSPFSKDLLESRHRLQKCYDDGDVVACSIHGLPSGAAPVVPQQKYQILSLLHNLSHNLYQPKDCPFSLTMSPF